MAKLSKVRRQDLIFQVLKGRDAGSALSAIDIEKSLKNEDLEISLRTIRRDLDELTETHGLTSTESRPERYYPAKDYDLKYELHLNENTLQVLLIALNNLKFTSHDYFKSFATQAETGIFDSLSPEIVTELRDSKSKYHFDYSTSGKPTSNNSKDFEKVLMAIRENRIITCNNDSPYQSPEYNKRRRRFAPYMFILTSGQPYLIVEDQEDQVFKKLRVTRVKDVHLSKSKFERKDPEEGFHLDSLMGGWGGIKDNSIDIEIICDNAMATYFKERAFHNSQRLTKLSEDRYSLTMTCSQGQELVRLLSSFGGHVKSIAPESLNLAVKEIWKSGLKEAA